MNIFVTDENPVIAATNLCDCHVIKMILETTQLLCTYDTIHGKSRPYKVTHINHPCQKSLTNKYNYVWLIQHLNALLKEYTFRYNKQHACQLIYNEFWKKYEENEIDFTLTTFPKCMPDEFKLDSVIDSYRNYYHFKKETLHRFKYTNRKEPNWLLK